MIERAEVSSSRSTWEVYENRWRKGLDGWDKTDADYPIPNDSSCSKEVACHKVGWKPRIRQERLGSGIWGARHKHIFEQPKRRVPNGTHGVVRGRGLATPSYSIGFCIINRPEFIVPVVFENCFMWNIRLMSEFLYRWVRRWILL